MSANDPEIPDSCPKCGANRLPSDYSAAFACGTLVSSKGNYHHTITCHHFSEFRKPLDAERDALAARVKELEEKLAEVTADRDSWADQADQRVADAVEAMKRESEWKAYAGRLEEFGNHFANLLACSMGLDETDEWANTLGAHKIRIASDAIADWEKAKETKP